MNICRKDLGQFINEAIILFKRKIEKNVQTFNVILNTCLYIFNKIT